VSRTDKTTPPWVRALHCYWREEIAHDHRHGECVVWRPRPSTHSWRTRRSTDAGLPDGEPDYWSCTCHPDDGGPSYYDMWERAYPRPSEFKFRQKQFSRKHRARLRNARAIAKQMRIEDFEDFDLPDPRHRHDAAWLVW
jgi:hypothetical protein